MRGRNRCVVVLHVRDYNKDHGNDNCSSEEDKKQQKKRDEQPERDAAATALALVASFGVTTTLAGQWSGLPAA